LKKFSSFLGDTKRYSNVEQDLRWDLKRLPKTVAYKILEIRRTQNVRKNLRNI